MKDLTLEVRKDIRQELRGLRVEAQATNAQIEKLTQETRDGFERLERKLESGAFSDQHIRERVIALEAWAEGQGYHPT